MNEQRPYNENDPWNDLPVPDSDQAWQSMKALLDKEEDDPRPLAPLWFKSCAPWAIALGLSLVALFLFVRPLWKDDKAVSVATPVQKKAPDQTKQPIDINREGVTSKAAIYSPHQTMEKNSGPAIAPASSEPISTTLRSTTSGNRSSANILQAGTIAKNSSRKASSLYSPSNEAAALVSVKENNRERSEKEELVVGKSEVAAPVMNTPVSQTQLAKSIAKDSLPAKALVTATDSAVAVAPVDSLPLNKTTPKKRFYLSAGVGMQQQIRSSGQASYAKTYNGNGLGDHIPSVYLRLHKGDRWFLQGEFRYGAPQLVPGFSYSQQSRYDTANNKVDVTRMQLKKLYYHQLPISINYSPVQNWLVGGGLVFSRFYRAVAEQQVESKNLATGIQTSMANTIRVPRFTDSFLYKTQVQFLVQTEYQLGRLSVGLRYKRDAQAYIRYTKPDGTILSERGEALEAILRFRLWKSGKK
ncbi:MAG: hypothetical protein JWP69_480 [Flaviaesturariibacter sp.]|nr:hypothetical protein [Flaviaesturariibacter sp.]